MTSENYPTISIVLQIAQSLLDNFLNSGDKLAMDKIKKLKEIVSKQPKSRFGFKETLGVCQSKAVKLHYIAIF